MALEKGLYDLYFESLSELKNIENIILCEKNNFFIPFSDTYEFLFLWHQKDGQRIVSSANFPSISAQFTWKIQDFIIL